MPGMLRSWLTRTIVALAFAALFFLSFRGSRLPAEARPSDWSTAAESARGMCRTLVGSYPASVHPATRTAIESLLAGVGPIAAERRRLLGLRSSLSQAELDAGLERVFQQFAGLAQKLDTALQDDPSVITLTGGAIIESAIELPVRSGAVVIHRRSIPPAVPAFTWRRADLTEGGREQTLDPPAAASYYAVLELTNAPSGTGEYTFHLGADTLRLKVTAPQLHPVEVAILGEGGKPTEAAVGLYTSQGQLLVPGGALDFGSAGYSYAPVNWREHGNARFWPGGPDNQTRCFFVRGGFTMPLPAGSYRLIVSKGPEFLPVDTVLQVKAGDGARRRVQLKRWVDMSARGWQSGDCHIHFERPGRAANQPLLLWTRAEDLRMNNILRMGDGRETYFQQYAWGARGRYIVPGSAFVPGQEDPRTSVIGHTIQLNLQAPVRDPGHYYLYSSVFEQTRRQGGLAGYAHVNADLFNVHRDMSLNVPLGSVDFAEICEFGYIKTDLWYEFLNLGFTLTAAAGSDAPWGGTVGDSRIYVYTGRDFNADDWFQALKRGHTFVTVGPMLEFTVDGKLPGDQIRLGASRPLRIHADVRAGYLNQPMEALEIVANGQVVRSEAVKHGRASLDFTLPLEGSAWIAARVHGAHTTPVYVTVAGRRHWDRKLVPALLDRREKQLDEIEQLLTAKNPTGLGGRGTWENPEAWQAGSERMRELIRRARQVYARLRVEAAEAR